MTETAKTLMGTFGMADFLIPLVLEDVTEEDAYRRTRDGDGPSVVWTIGHLMHCRYHVMNLLGDERADPHGDTFMQAATDGEGYPTMTEIQSEWSSLAADFRAAVMSKSESEWDAAETGAHDEKSLRDQVVFFAWHEGYHMGALGAVRKEMGYPGPAEKVREARKVEAE